MGNKTTKQMLIELYEGEREQDRCQVVHELKKKAEKTIDPYRKTMDKMGDKISGLNSEIANIRKDINKEIDKRDTALRQAKLYHFDTKACGDALHDDLMEFDKETKKNIREILEEK